MGYTTRRSFYTSKERTLFSHYIAVKNLPATEQRLKEYASAQMSDQICSPILQYCQEGWPDKLKIQSHLKTYWKVQGNFTVSKNILLYWKRIVIPRALQKDTLQMIHEGHQDSQRSQLRARHSVWWSGIITQLKKFVENSPTCVQNFTPHYEPLISTLLPDYQWQKVASDIFYLKGDHYMVMSTSSPYFPQSNGCVEMEVRTMKNLLKHPDGFGLTMYKEFFERCLQSGH